MTAANRMEHDSMGDIAVPFAALWGAQTQRSLLHFHISSERMPPALLLALAQVDLVIGVHAARVAPLAAQQL